MNMGFTDGLKSAVNYVVFDNPISKKVGSMLPTEESISLPAELPTPPQITLIKENTPLWKLATENGPFVRLAGIMGASGVALGAYGAHKSYPKDKVQELKSIFETGNRIHLIHTLAVLGVPLCKNPKLSGTLLIVGTILFSGSCYYHAFTAENKFGKLAPVGGSLLIAGWIAMIF